MIVYEKIGFEDVSWTDNSIDMSQIIHIKIPFEDIAERSADLKLIGIQLIFEHNEEINK